MAQLCIFLLTLNTITSAHVVDFSRPSFISFRSVKSGERVSLNCPLKDINRPKSVVWYKQIFGEMPQKVGEKLMYKTLKIYSSFNTSGFTMETTENKYFLIIPLTNKDHGGLYYCEAISTYEATLSNGTFLTVKGDEDEKVTVFQSSVSDSVPVGASVTLQCSVLSESRAAELQVLWFRAAPSQSHPQLIYTHHNSSLQCESKSSTHTCVYNLSKNIFSLNDTGTYYCAVALCGKIIFGNGTRVQLENLSQIGPEVIYLTVVVVVCMIVIFTQAFLLCKMRNGEKSRVRCQTDSVNERTTGQGGVSVELNYAAIHYNKNNTKRVTRKRDRPEDCVYSEVLHAT
ncbi:uncharacterized protein LOC124385735 [Silurus meridionalis]|uniref:uncharacterized protein LOC124385735 n=1 Tax=Silurus meridionalis TaxID=175797 RepID=UPI001EE9D070|nr:uncharacterized protein LOC124385735 [Silurus meridionalis]